MWQFRRVLQEQHDLRHRPRLYHRPPCHHIGDLVLLHPQKECELKEPNPIEDDGVRDTTLKCYQETRGNLHLHIIIYRR